MDFVVKLPPSPSGNHSIFVVVDRLTKMAHFIAMKETYSASQIAELFFVNIFRLHGLPLDLISDRGSVFKSKFWSTLTQHLGVKSNLSTSFHPQTDGQTERVNQSMEQYLRLYCNYQQDDWERLLPVAEFTYNNSLQSSSFLTPFVANYGQHPHLDISVDSSLPSRHQPASDLASTISSLHSQLRKDLQPAATNMKRFYDRKVKEAPDLVVGDFVWLVRRFVKTQRPSSKLDHKRLGPFKILATVGPLAFRLDLPPSMKIHPVFHVSLLERHNANTIPGRLQPPPAPVIIDDEPEYEVAEILDSRIRRKSIQYLVDWVGYDASHRLWLPLSSLGGSEEAIQEFHQRNPSKPTPPAPAVGRRSLPARQRPRRS